MVRSRVLGHDHQHHAASASQVRNEYYSIGCLLSIYVQLNRARGLAWICATTEIT